MPDIFDIWSDDEDYDMISSGSNESTNEYHFRELTVDRVRQLIEYMQRSCLVVEDQWDAHCADQELRDLSYQIALLLDTVASERDLLKSRVAKLERAIDGLLADHSSEYRYSIALSHARAVRNMTEE